MQDADATVNLVPKLLTVIIDRDDSKRLEDILNEKHAVFHYIFNGMGTASSEILKAFGLSGTEKSICICMETTMKIKSIMTSVVERLDIVHPGHGIAFVIPVSGISATISNTFNVQLKEYKERLEDWMDREAEKIHEEARFELVVAVINQGYSEILMDAAKVAGARGGTIVHARRTGNEDMVKFFGISLQAEKEIVGILIPHDKKRGLMEAVSKSCGMRTDARGIIFSLPVESCAGISETVSQTEHEQ